ncbi:hypothetical protein [Nocardioides panaciterrulae]|uniref:DUF4345 domain-containing protein n=1 Tax=Nocardioides panaciterrulae TaxID=661492 RepID=A0A7Y9E3Y8_9ACTN|nr:hypothetical protein [Nocardioides panaciterrulae]NYD40520.1 hypothetical protein [Nocardioides panaciterrulae]
MPQPTAQPTAQPTVPATRPTAELFHYDDRARLASYRRTAPRPPTAPAGAWLALVVSLTVMYAEWAFFPQDLQGQSDANWALGFMMISLAGALRILVGNPGRHLVAVAAILVAGVGFLLRAFLFTADPTWVLVYEGLCGALLLLGGLMSLAAPTLEAAPPPPERWD